MTNNNEDQIVNLDYNPADVEAPGRDMRFILKIPGPDRPLIVKILPDPRNGNGKTWFRSLRQWPYLIGPNRKTDTRSKVCLSFFGEKSFENDFYWECKKKLSELRNLGKGNSTEAQKLEDFVGENGLLKPKDGGWILVIEPGSPLIKAVRVTQTVLQQLTGKDATDTKPAIPSLIKVMASDGVSPFDVRQQKPTLGWIKIYKTGEGLATRYHVEPVKHEIEVVNGGKKYRVTEYTELSPDQKILDGKLTLGDFPDVVDFESKQRWTLDECETFVKSLCTEIPERFKKRQSQSGRVDETDEAPTVVSDLNQLPTLPGVNAASVAPVVAPDDIPFA